MCCQNVAMSRVLADPVDDVIQSVRKRYDELTRSQKLIAEAIVEDPEFVAFATVDKMAAKLGVSPSTVVRFTYRLGLSGYQDLQNRVRTLVRSQMRSSVANGDEQQVLAHLGESTFAHSFGQDLDHLRRTIAGLDESLLMIAVDALASARRVIITADGSAYSVASYTNLVFERVRGNVEIVRADADGVGRLADLTPEDVVVAFTFPPYASTVLRVVRWAKRRNATVIAITDSPISPAGQMVDVVLPAIVSGIGPHNTMVPAMSVANALLNELVLRNREQALRRYATVTDLMNDWDLYVLKSGDDQ